MDKKLLAVVSELITIRATLGETLSGPQVEAYQKVRARAGAMLQPLIEDLRLLQAAELLEIQIADSLDDDEMTYVTFDPGRVGMHYAGDGILIECHAEAHMVGNNGQLKLGSASVGRHNKALRASKKKKKKKKSRKS